jgi:hypothetical protein
MSVGVTKDYKLKVSNLHASHTLGWSKRLFFFCQKPWRTPAKRVESDRQDDMRRFLGPRGIDRALALTPLLHSCSFAELVSRHEKIRFSCNGTLFSGRRFCVCAELGQRGSAPLEAPVLSLQEEQIDSLRNLGFCVLPRSKELGNKELEKLKALHADILAHLDRLKLSARYSFWKVINNMVTEFGERESQ